jgi:hypothetical protein
MKKMTSEIEPTPEDYAKVRDDVAHAPERMLDILAQREARRRIEAERRRAEDERRERRRRMWRRLLTFGRAA